jgi:hypothetical protein
VRPHPDEVEGLRLLIREELHGYEQQQADAAADQLLALCALERRMRELEKGLLWTGVSMILMIIAAGWWSSM